MWKKTLLMQYKKDVKDFIESAKQKGLNDDQIRELFKQSLKQLDKNKKESHNIFRRNVFKILLLVSIIFSVFIYILLNVHTPTSSIVLRNVQGLTYPALRIVRSLSVPIIKLFPSITDLYDESCLVENPYFFLSDMECWPCENVQTVVDLTGVEGFNAIENARQGTPILIKGLQKKVLFSDLKDLYNTYTTELDHDSRRLKIGNINIGTLSEMFQLSEANLSSNAHIHWRINKMTTARIIRKLFHKPHFLPDRSGQAVERFLYIDGPTAPPYKLPSTECSYVFVIQASGERTIALKPAKECQNTCKTVSVVMKPSYVLLYNWWYWRPVSLPTSNHSNVAISYINSYC